MARPLPFPTRGGVVDLWTCGSAMGTGPGHLEIFYKNNKNKNQNHYCYVLQREQDGLATQLLPVQRIPSRFFLPTFSSSPNNLYGTVPQPPTKAT